MLYDATEHSLQENSVQGRNPRTYSERTLDLPDPSKICELALDTETYDPRLSDIGPGFVYDQAKVVGISIYYPGCSMYFPLRHKEGNINNWPQVKAWLKVILSNPMVTVIFANAKYDLEALWSLGIEVKAWCVDIQVVESLIDEEKKSYSLASLSKDYGLKPKTREVIEGLLLSAGYVLRNGKPDWSKLWKLPVNTVGEYAKDDAMLTYEIFQLQKPIIEEEELREVFELECELTPVLFDMRIKGIDVDLAKAEAENARLMDDCQMKLDFIRQWAPNLNPFSPIQLGELVREVGLDPPKTEKDNDSVTNLFLLESGVEELIRIGEYRQQEKIRRDFVESVVLNGSYKGRVHPQWYQTRGTSFMSGDDVAGTRSGRVACSNPNLSQIPSRHKVLGPLVRSLFIARNGGKWFKGDLSQQEPRISLHYAYLLKLTGSAEARQLYIDNPATDFHDMVMDMVNKVRNDPIERDQAKTINLARAYGMGRKKTAVKLKLSLSQADGILASYDRGFPFMKELLEYCMEVADQRGYVKTVLGRRRRFNMWEPTHFQRGKFPIKGKEAAIKAYGSIRRAHLHKAMNSVVQGSAAEQMKKALIILWKERIDLLITLYDEIGASVNSEREAKLIKEVTENIIPFKVPHLMKYKLMDSWGG